MKESSYDFDASQRLLNMKLSDALKNGQSEFKVHISAFDGVPGYKNHIAYFEQHAKQLITHAQQFDWLIFRIQQ